MILKTKYYFRTNYRPSNFYPLPFIASYIPFTWQPPLPFTAVYSAFKCLCATILFDVFSIDFPNLVFIY